jgi:hypothetical protein
MNAVKMAAVVLIVAGVLGLVYGSFTYTKDTHEAKLGPLELSIKDKETVSIDTHPSGSMGIRRAARWAVLVLERELELGPVSSSSQQTSQRRN